MRTAVIRTALCYLSTSLPWILLLSDIVPFLDLCHQAHGIQVSRLACYKEHHELQLCILRRIRQIILQRIRRKFGKSQTVIYRERFKP